MLFLFLRGLYLKGRDSNSVVKLVILWIERDIKDVNIRVGKDLRIFFCRSSEGREESCR